AVATLRLSADRTFDGLARRAPHTATPRLLRDPDVRRLDVSRSPLARRWARGLGARSRCRRTRRVAAPPRRTFDQKPCAPGSAARSELERAGLNTHARRRPFRT